MNDLTVTAVGRDRPGIVAGVTGVLYELGCNLADCSMTRLRGDFAMILLVEAPSEVDSARLQEQLEVTGEEFGLEIRVTEASAPEHETPSRPFVISVYGADRPGIVHQVSKALADREINITDLTSHLVQGIYTMVLDANLPEGTNPAEVESELRTLAGDLGVDLNFRAGDADEL